MKASMANDLIAGHRLELPWLSGRGRAPRPSARRADADPRHDPRGAQALRERRVPLTMAPKHYSLEFFPPRTPEGVEKLRAARRQLGQLKPAFCSVTFGAGGSTREGTLETVLEIRGEGVAAAPHISCIGSTRENVARGARAVPQPRHPAPRRAARRHAVGHGRRGRVPLRERARRVHPRDDRRLVPHRRRRVSGDASAGALARATTSRTSSARSTPARTRRSRSTSSTPTPTSASSTSARRPASTCRSCRASCRSRAARKLARFSDACGAEIPRWIRRRLEGYGDDIASIRAFGLDVVTDLCDRAARAAARPACTSTR